MISICILTWNRPKFLKICLDDILKKISYVNDCEILIMDDGSNDETCKLLENYKTEKRIKIIRNKKHEGIAAYKKLFAMAKGDYIIEIDDDVLQVPFYFDKIMVEYMNEYSDYGFLALNVIQNEYTNGAKPDSSHYVDDMRGDKVIQYGPTGGWCTCFREKDYRKIKVVFNLKRLGFRNAEDAALSGLFKKYLKLKSGIIKNHICFHASGPHYAKEYGHLEREIEKYKKEDLTAFTELYESFL